MHYPDKYIVHKWIIMEEMEGKGDV